ncbi:ArsR/SmtB family transcription factor [Streptacidiphilus carbonis]|uniref:ArsR/SmtB family transcription factor n=1 Tax=Streptacidiphilus carbonis TaxID=105422 RepID=UPI0005A8E58E|nr:winged helix-turn-helix domain-containing protein [Streptacidiphilus carbonis]
MEPLPTRDLPPPEELLEVDSAVQFKALSHPLRQRLLFALARRATMSQLATALGAQKGNVAHHLRVLRDAGMVRVVETRQVRGGTEQYYQRTARRMTFAGHQAAATAAMFDAVAEELDRTTTSDPLLILRHVRLTTAQAKALSAELERLVENTEEAGPDDPVHGVLVALYEQGLPGTAGAPATAKE